MATIKGRYLAGQGRWKNGLARTLKNPHIGECRGFAILEALITFLREQNRIRNHEGVLGRRGKRVSLKSPVRQIRTPGSVRGLSGNWQTYRKSGTDRGKVCAGHLASHCWE